MNLAKSYYVLYFYWNSKGPSTLTVGIDVEISGGRTDNKNNLGN